jgi:hypothetical protein
MTGSKGLLAGAILLVSVDRPMAITGAAVNRAAAPFAVASIRFEQNATDGDVEIVIEAKGGQDGLAKLTVVSPDGRTIVNVTAPDASTLGLRQFRFESPEPKNTARLKAAYPEGVYTFTGATAGGVNLRGESRLSHRLPPAASFGRPGADAKGVALRGVEISWAPVKDLAAYIVYVEQHDLDVEVTAKVPATVTTFAVPDGFLRAGTEYQVGLGTVNREGNISFVETTLTTAGKE